jgi:hypothetical protein
MFSVLYMFNVLDMFSVLYMFNVLDMFSVLYMFLPTGPSSRNTHLCSKYLRRNY